MANVYRPRKVLEVAPGYCLRYTGKGTTWLTFNGVTTLPDIGSDCIYGTELSSRQALDMADAIDSHVDSLKVKDEDTDKKPTMPINTRITIFGGVHVAVGFLLKSSTNSSGYYRMIPPFGPRQLRALAREIRLAAKVAGDPYEEDTK